MDEAQAEFDKAIELDPSNLVPVYQKGIILTETDPIDALQYLDRAEALAPHEPGIAYQKGLICQSIDDTKGATEQFTNALIYGHPEKKEIHNAIENIMEKVINDFLQ
jgi:tetratricopeptide (TPR) repeat protein